MLYLSVRRIICMVYVEGFIFLDYTYVLSLCLSFICLVALPQLYALFKTDKSFCNLNHLRELSFCGFTLLEQGRCPRQCSRMSAGSLGETWSWLRLGCAWSLGFSELQPHWLSPPNQEPSPILVILSFCHLLLI